MTHEHEGVRTAWVTGASVGIGRAIAVAFGERGWKVALGARRVERLDDAAAEVEKVGGTPFVHPLDVADPTSVDAFVRAATGELGPLDVLVNNAGITRPGDLAHADVAALETTVTTNLLGAMYCSRAFVRPLLDADAPGDVVFISSDAVHNPRPGLVAYGASKAGLEHLARGLAYEVEGRGIRVTTVRVGPTIGTEFATEWGDPEQFMSLVERWQRFGSQRHFGTVEPADIAHAVVLAVTARPGTHLHLVEVQPEAPRG